jgi:Tol biopolymer transport system component
MPTIDDRITDELRKAAPRPGGAELFRPLEARMRRRRLGRRLGSGALVVVVIGGSLAGFVALQHAFRGEDVPPAVPPLPENGALVTSRGDDGGTHLYVAPAKLLTEPRGSEEGIDPAPMFMLTDGDGFTVRDRGPAVSPDGTTVAFTRTVLETGRTSIWTIGLDGASFTQITDPAYHASAPAWSPDGGWIAFTAAVGRVNGIVEIDRELFVARPDGSELRQLTGTEVSGVSGPSWSPDSRIVFAAKREASDATSDLFVIDTDETGPPIPLTSTQNLDETDPAWSPDGRSIAFGLPGGIWTMPALGGDATLVEADGQSDAAVEFRNSDPGWSPDGSLLTFVRTYSPSEIFVYADRLDGSGPYRLVIGEGFAWQPVPRGSDPSIQPSPTQEPGRDVGLGFRICDVRGKQNIDFFGDGSNATVWTGIRVREGACPIDDPSRPTDVDTHYLVAVDFDHDGRADAWTGLAGYCSRCEPFAATDLDADGTKELIVLLSHSSTPQYGIYKIGPLVSERGPSIEPILVRRGQVGAGFPSGEPITFWTGGDEGFSGAVDCEGYPDHPVLIVSSSNGPVDGAVKDIIITRLRLVNGAFDLIDSNQYTQPAGDPIPFDHRGNACGVDFDPDF